jgi:hypothetical protein
MRIIDLEAFLKLRPGTVFAKYESCIFDSIQIKGESIKDYDFWYQNLLEVESNNSEEMMDTLLKAEKKWVFVSIGL